MEKLTTCHVIASRETSSLCFAVSLQGWLGNTTHGKHPGSKPSLDPPWTSRVSCWRFSMTVCCTHHLCGLVGCHTVSQKFFLETTVVYVDLIDFNLPINKSWKKDIKKTPQPLQHLDSAIVIYPSLFYANSATNVHLKKKCHVISCAVSSDFFQTSKHFMPFFTPFPTTKVLVGLGDILRPNPRPGRRVATRPIAAGGVSQKRWFFGVEMRSAKNYPALPLGIPNNTNKIWKASGVEWRNLGKFSHLNPLKSISNQVWIQPLEATWSRI